MRKIFINKESISWKLITPSAIIIIVFSSLVYFIASTYIEKVIDKTARHRASEISETFNISVEADSSFANLTRTTNSVATFEDINRLYVIDPSVNKIVLSSNNSLTKKMIVDVKDELTKKLLLRSLKYKKNIIFKKKNSDYVYVYHFIVKSKKSLSYKKLVLLIDLNDGRLKKLFSDHLNALMSVFIFSVMLSMSAIYFRVDGVVVRPLKGWLRVINRQKESDAPVAFDYESNDELGVLVKAYNQVSEDEFEYKQQLVSAKEESEAASKAKGEFLSVMSHEIRTPMNGVIGGCSFLDKTELNQDQKKYTSMIKGSAQQLLSLVNDILDFSKIESGKIELEFRPIDIGEVIQQVQLLFEKDVNIKNIKIEYIEPEEKLPYILCDEVRLRQVLINIIGNAVKFTQEGGIRISFSELTIDKDNVQFVLEIQDTGIGIDINDPEDLFRSFTQGDASTTRKYGGTGLGLTISKKLTEALGGELWFNSEPLKGTSFFLRFKFNVCDEKPETFNKEVMNQIKETKRPISVLLVEDTETNQIIATTILEGMGCDVDCAVNGEEAVKAVADKQFDLVLMDCFMPVMDGYEATRLIRKYEAKTKSKALKIIALTADVSKENQLKCEDAGMDDFLIKPYEPDTLMEKIHQYIQQA